MSYRPSVRRLRVRAFPLTLSRASRSLNPKKGSGRDISRPPRPCPPPKGRHMTNKILALVIIIGIMAAAFSTAAPAGAGSAPHPAAQTLSTSNCTTDDLNDIVAVYGFDSSTYKSAAPTVPEGVKSYLARLLTTRLGTCASQAGASAAKACSPGARETDPRALWQQLRFCVGVVALEHPVKPDPLRS